MNDHYILALFIFGTLLITAFAITITLFLVVQKQRQVRNKLERQQMEHNYANELLRNGIEAHELALAEVSREIHDNIGQVLTFCRMQLSTLGNNVSSAKAGEMLHQNMDVILKSVRELRMLSRGLNGGLISERELRESIQQELDKINSTSVSAVLRVSGEPEELTAENKLLVFRIIQEALQNVVKHAKASRVEVTLRYQPNELIVTVTDNGIGFDVAGAMNANTLGMTSMQQRATILKADLKIETLPVGGTRLTLVTPIDIVLHE